MASGVVATPIVLYTGEIYASLVCLAAVIFIVCVELLQRYWGIAIPFWSVQLRRTKREHEDFSWASISFLLTLFLLLWLAPVPVALAASAMLAFGDGSSALVGRAIGAHKIWYNRAKSWEGSVAGLTAGLLGAWLLIYWFAVESGQTYQAAHVGIVCLLGAWFAMLGESMPRVQDNVVVPVFAAIPMTVAWMALDLEPTWGLLVERLTAR